MRGGGDFRWRGGCIYNTFCEYSIYVYIIHFSFWYYKRINENIKHARTRGSAESKKKSWTTQQQHQQQKVLLLMLPFLLSTRNIIKSHFHVSHVRRRRRRKKNLPKIKKNDAITNRFVLGRFLMCPADVFLLFFFVSLCRHRVVNIYDIKIVEECFFF